MTKLFVVATALALAAVAGTTHARASQRCVPIMGLRRRVAAAVRHPAGRSQSPQVLDNVAPHTVPGSKLSFTRAQIANRHAPADWFPEDHPAMPEIVGAGGSRRSRRSMPVACATIPTARAGPRTPTSPA